MSDRSRIEWCDATWNPFRGCSRVSDGCRNCYAERMAARGLPGLLSPTTGEPFARMRPLCPPNAAGVHQIEPRWTGRVELIESQLEVPLRWRRPRRIFVNSISDMFHEAATEATIDRIFAVMALCQQHTFLVLTKRANRMHAYFGDNRPHEIDKALLWAVSLPYCRGSIPCFVQRDGVQGWPLPNVWLGVSVEDRRTADERIPLLLMTPAARRFISYEPALGSVDISRYLQPRMTLTYGSNPPPRLDWVIAGGESGPGARPAHPDWFRSVRDQCQAAQVPFFFKQWGEWAPERKRWPGDKKGCSCGARAGRVRIDTEGRDVTSTPGLWDSTDKYFWRIGKGDAGRLLDGREWNKFPEAARG